MTPTNVLKHARVSDSFELALGPLASKRLLVDMHPQVCLEVAFAAKLAATPTVLADKPVVFANSMSLHLISSASYKVTILDGALELAFLMEHTHVLV